MNEEKLIKDLKDYFYIEIDEKLTLNESVIETIKNITKKPIRRKYNNLMRLAFGCVIILLIPSIILIISSLDNREPGHRQYRYGDQTLTYVVYNATIESLQNKNIYDGKNKINNNLGNLYNNISINTDIVRVNNDTNNMELLKYDKIEIYQAHRFLITLEDTDFHFIEEITGDKTVEVIISFFGLSSNSYWYSQQMIIFKGRDGMIGCLGSTIGMIMNDSNKIPDDLENLYFGTYIFLGKDVVVKDTNVDLYEFIVNLKEPFNIQMTVYGDGKNHDDYRDIRKISRHYQSITNSYQLISGSEVFNILDLIYAKKVNFSAKIESIDPDKGILHVSSSTHSFIKSIKYDFSGAIYDAENKEISITNLEVGDTIESYYYQNYHNYEPSNVRVSTFKVNKIVNNKNQIL